MIKIEAFVREDKFEDVKEALAKIEVHGITVYQVMGCGIQKGYREVIRGNEVEINMLPKIKNAGSIFLGEYSPDPLGDYMSGTNHVLPTGGTAKFYSALGVYDFVKYSSYSYYPKNVLGEFKEDVIKFAKSEGLDAHANSVAVRFEEE